VQADLAVLVVYRNVRILETRRTTDTLRRLGVPARWILLLDPPT
jgi:hypothetical protein